MKNANEAKNVTELLVRSLYARAQALAGQAENLPEFERMLAQEMRLIARTLDSSNVLGFIKGETK